MSVFQAEAEDHHLLLSVLQIVQQDIDMLTQHDGFHISFRCYGIVVRNEIAQIGIILFADRRLERCRLSGDLHDLHDLLFRHLKRFRKLRGGRLVAELQRQLSLHLAHLVNGLYHMHRNTDGTCLIRQRSGNGLSDPPGGISRELVALRVIEFFHALDQSEISLLDKIQEAHAAAGVPLRDADHETEVGLDQPLLRPYVSLCLAPCEFDFLFRRQQRNGSDLL